MVELLRLEDSLVEALKFPRFEADCKWGLQVRSDFRAESTVISTGA